MNDDEKRTIGVIIERSNNYGTEYVHVRTMLREGEADSPINCSWGMLNAREANAIADLELHGFVTDMDGRFIAFEPSYRNAFSVELSRAEAMVRTLKRVHAVLKKDEAYEPGDVFTAFCKAIGAKWTVIQIGGGGGSRYTDRHWRFVPIAEGRNHLRNEIAAARAAFADRHPDKASAA